MVQHIVSFLVYGLELNLLVLHSSAACIYMQKLKINKNNNTKQFSSCVREREQKICP